MLITIAIVIVVAVFLKRIAIETERYNQKIRVLEQKQTQQEESKKQLENTLKQEVERLNKEVESAKQAKALQKASTKPTTQYRVASATIDPKLYIYNHESGNNPARWNSSGCLGLGQACPAQKLLNVCPDINDYACQDAWFTNYAVKRYGSWQGAYNFWIQNKWW